MRTIATSLFIWMSLHSLTAQTGFWSPVSPPRAHYTVTCAFDPATARLTGTETITLRNDSTRPMERLAIAWSISSDKTVEVLANGKPASVLLPPGRKEAISPLLLQLPELLKPGALLELKLTFTSEYKSEFDKDRGLLLQGWFPQLWWGFGHADDYAVRVTTPPGWSVVTSGVLDPASGFWKAEAIRDFGAGIFNLKRYSVEHAQAGDVRVTVVHTDAGAKCAQLVLKTAVDAIGFYLGRFGVYPHRSLTIIPGMDYPAGGYPVAAAMVEIHGEEQMDKKPEAHFRWITAHEIGHMYWSQYVLAAGEDDLNWLMVGLGIFADREYRRARGIPEPIGLLADNYTGGLAQGIDTTMDLTAEQEEVISWDYNNVVEHGKSSAMMDALESNIGAGVFDRAYRRTLREFHGRRLGWRDFERICEEESGEDLDWFFESWVRTNQYAFYRAVKTSAGEVDVVSEGTLRERVPVVATFEDGTQQTQFTDRLAEGTRFVFNGSSPLKEVKIDPRNTLWMPDAAPPLTSLALELKIARMNVTGTAEEALQLLPRAREVGLAESLTWRHLGLMLYDGKRYAEALECFRKALDTTTDNDYRFLALVWQGQLLDLTGDRTAAIAAYQAAHATASKQVFRHDQYKLVIDQAWVEQRLQTPFVRQ